MPNFKFLRQTVWPVQLERRNGVRRRWKGKNNTSAELELDFVEFQLGEVKMREKERNGKERGEKRERTGRQKGEKKREKMGEKEEREGEKEEREVFLQSD